MLKRLSSLGLCPVHVKIPASTLGALEVGPKPQSGHFLKKKKAFDNFD
jgi:hypothetical protein